MIKHFRAACVALLALLALAATAGQHARAQTTLLSPLPGTSISTTSQTFIWSHTSAVASEYWVSLGDQGIGSTNVYNASTGANLQAVITNIPASSRLYLRLWTKYASGWTYDDYFPFTTAGNGAFGTLFTPTPGSTLQGANAIFTWVANTENWLTIGTTGVGSTEIYNQSVVGAANVTISTLPISGTIYVRVWTRAAGATWASRDYTLTGSPGTLASMAPSAPTPGFLLPGPTAAFAWLGATNATEYWISIGTTGVGSTNLVNTSTGAAVVYTATNLPADGPVYVRLWSKLSGTWFSKDYAYKGSNGVPAFMFSPWPSTLLSGSAATFNWSNVFGGGYAGVNVTQYWVSVGTTGVGSTNIFNQSTGTSTTVTVSGLPGSGTINVRLWSLTGGAWRSRDYTYRGSPTLGGTASYITSPGLGSQNVSSASSQQDFFWQQNGGINSGLNVSENWLSVGTTPGGTEVFNQSVGAATSATVSNVPTGNTTIYVRLWSKIAGAWVYNDTSYHAAPPAGPSIFATLIAPSSPVGYSQFFTWTSGTNVSEYWVTIGSSYNLGSSDIYSASAGTKPFATFCCFPNQGAYYFTLWSKIGDGWYTKNYQFNGSAPP